MMKKITIFIFLAIFLLIFFIHPKKVVAGELDCTATGVSGMILDENDQRVGVVWFGLTGGNDNPRGMDSNDGSFSFPTLFGDYEDELVLSYNFPNNSPYKNGSIILSQCQGSIIHVKKIVPDDSDDNEITPVVEEEEKIVPVAEKASCNTYIEDSTHKVRVKNLSPGEEYQIWIIRTKLGRNMGFTEYWGVYFKQPQDSSTYEFPIQVGENWRKGDYEVEINTYPSTFLKKRGDFVASCSFYLSVFEEVHPLCCPEGYSDERKYCGLDGLLGMIDLDYNCCAIDESRLPADAHAVVDKVLCSSLSDSSQWLITCNEGQGIETALGCIPTKPATFVKFLLNFAIGIGGGIAFLLMIFGGLQIILSGGNPDKVKAGKEIITAALGGLLLIIFSVFILRVIGVDILQIPGFGK